MRTSGDTLTTLPSRKRLNHRGPLSIDVASAWYFITLCADWHQSWVGRDDPIAPYDYPAAVAKRQTNLEPSEKE